MHRPVSGGTLGSTSYLSDVEPSEPISRIGGYGRTVVPERPVTIAETRGGVAEREVRLRRPEEERMRSASVLTCVGPLLAGGRVPRREQCLVADEAPGCGDAQDDRHHDRTSPSRRTEKPRLTSLGSKQ